MWKNNPRKSNQGWAFLALLMSFASIQASPAAWPAAKDGVHGKLGPGLEHEISWLKARPAYDYRIPVIIQVEESAFRADAATRRLRGESQRNMLPLVNAYTARLTSRQIRHLADSDRVRYLTLDMPIRTDGKPTGAGGGGGGSGGSVASNLRIIGADYVNRYSGAGVTIAVFDSGVSKHPDLDLKGNKDRIVASFDFTSGVPVETSANYSDAYGHGTHVSGIIVGDGNKSSGSYAGVADQADILDLTVVDGNGYGLTSNLIMAIDWLIANNHIYRARVANLSLGHPPVESYATDPLCQAVERLVESGVVTVVSSGNLGRLEGYPVIWGGISSPGNSPAVITVGPIDTMGTLTHTDDQATSYGSRGYTYLDEYFKPDVVAPGNQVGSLLAKFSRLHTDYPELQIDDYYIRLSGSSMAAGYVSGAVALMLDANPALSPRLVKAILGLTAIKLRNPHMLEQGNGLLNVATAVALAEAIDVSTEQVMWEVEPYWDLDGEWVWAGGAFASGDHILYSQLVNPAAGQFWGSGNDWESRIAWDDSISYNDGYLWTDGILDPGSTIWDRGLFGAEGTFWAEGFFWAESMFWVEGLFEPSSQFWTEGFFWAEATFWAEGLFWSGQNFSGGDSASLHNYAGD